MQYSATCATPLARLARACYGTGHTSSPTWTRCCSFTWLDACSMFHSKPPDINRAAGYAVCAWCTYTVAVSPTYLRIDDNKLAASW